MAEDAETLSTVEQEQLWVELGHCVSGAYHTHESIDDALRKWLQLTTRLHLGINDSHDQVLGCAHRLLNSQLFQVNAEYVRTQIIHSLLQEDDSESLHAIVSLLLLDGRGDESTFARMIDEACFPRLLDLINDRQDDHDLCLHRLLLQLLYDMSRVQRLKTEDLSLVQDAFVHRLFGIIEGVSNDVEDPYHYPTIRVLLVLNEQYMLASTDPHASPEGQLTNRIVKCLSLYGNVFRTFGENIILLLNRETETSLQLLILKLLYLVFTTKATYEYFYTNDLRVLVDVIIRNLMDLPDEKMSLRHTYLRVMYPLLAHTQLNQAPHYKRDEVIRVLRILRGSHNAHFAPADETTLRLVQRVANVDWLDEADMDSGSCGQSEVARKILGISLSPSQCASSISMGDVAGVKERPGVQTPSRSSGMLGRDGSTVENAHGPCHPDMVTAVKMKERPLPAVPDDWHEIGAQETIQLHIDRGGKKIPPKTPPPRRFGKMKTMQGSRAEAAAPP
ncbi:hypothetical protein CDD82_560 [Ophiocordyceps australis]|uniref:SPIN90/Ldb17 leucine-rich domain-containing protein n=1 Tax=Ophiocordyceps australis TaxID=1399860 RepID=A0A2C5YN48_9HYPO|nr:hypothetical protein CDD82_560 [Ophiocordyceps australis]